MVRANWRKRIPGSREKRHRNEDGDEYERCGDDGAGDFFHGQRCGAVGVLDSLGDVALDVFDDHDGVIDDESGRERNSEQRQRVDREAEELDERKCAD